MQKNDLMDDIRLEKRNIINTKYDTINAIRRLSARKPCLTRTDISHAMNVSLATASREIRDLINVGAVTDTQDGLMIRPDFAYFLGIQISTNDVRIAFLDFTLKPLDKTTLRDFLSRDKDGDTIMDTLWNYNPIEDKDENDGVNRKAEQESLRNQGKYYLYYNITPNDSSDEKKETVIDAIRRAIRYFVENIEPYFSSVPLLSIGLATPGLTDMNGVVRFAPNAPALINEYVKSLINTKLLDDRKLLLTCTHDTIADMLWIKESLYDKEFNGDKDEKDVVVLHFGSGVGASHVFNQTLYYGKNNAAGEIGHIIKMEYVRWIKERLDKKREEDKSVGTEKFKKDDGTPFLYSCNCGTDNCIESEIRNEIFDGLMPNAFFKRICDITNKKDSEAALKIYFDKRPARLKLYKAYVQHICNEIIKITDPGLLVIAGSMVPLFEQDIYNHNIRFDNPQKIVGGNCIVRVSKGSVESVARGAAIAAYHKCLDRNAYTDEPVKVAWKSLHRIPD